MKELADLIIGVALSLLKEDPPDPILHLQPVLRVRVEDQDAGHNDELSALD